MSIPGTLCGSSVYEDGAYRCQFSVYHAGARQRRHAHSNPSVSVVLAGRLREVGAGGAETEPGFLSIGVKPTGWEHENDYGPEGAAILSVTLASGAEADEVWRVGRAGWRAGGAALRSFVSAAVRGDLDEERIADFLAIALAGDPAAARRSSAAPGWLLRVRDEIADGQSRIGEIARTHGVHRVYLARQFKAWFGSSLTAYRQQARAGRAASASVLERTSLGAVAATAGYADQSHMTRAIAATLGVTPGQLRAFGRQIEAIQV